MAKSPEELVLDFFKKLLKDSPFEGKAFLAGGAIRDQIMGKPIKDIDIVVALPDGSIKFAEWVTKKVGAYKEGSNPVIYPRFGTAKFNLRGIKIGGVDLSNVDLESVMTRGEKYEPGSRKPEVVYSDLKTDAERRDLTVNSLFQDLVTGEIKDLTGKGIDDIKKGVVRTPLDPDITFKDDPLRMLRAIRFAVKYDWTMPRSLFKAIVKNADMLKTISAERIQDELNKMLLTGNPDAALKALSLTGLNKHVIPELDATKNVTQNKYHKDDVFDHILEVVRNTPPDLEARLAALFHDIGKPQTKTIDDNGDVHFYGHEDVGAEIAQEALKRLKYSNDVIETVSNIVQNHMRLKAAGPTGSDISDKALRKFMTKMGQSLPTALKVMHADNISHEETASMPHQIDNIKTRIEKLSTDAPSKPKLPVNGHDLMKHFNLKPGPHLKDMLAAIEDAWYENPNLTKGDALQIAANNLPDSMVAKKPTSTPAQSASKHSIIKNLLRRKIKNPETDNDILVGTALKYDKNHPAYINARNLVDAEAKRHGINIKGR